MTRESLLPNTEGEYQAMLARCKPYLKTHCIECGNPFTYENTKTRDGWRETQISSTCEVCFDDLFDNWS
jgi:hypothetical protein